MKKVITFSLWGKDNIYNVGAIKNAETFDKFYTGFECWFYIHKDTVPEQTISALSKIPNIKIIMKTGNLNVCKPRMWRFEAIDDPDVSIMMSRDCDSRISSRETSAVNEWLKSNKLFHIMRDHPYHTVPILAGMFGTKKITNIPSWKILMDKATQHNTYQYDQDFLRNFIYPVIKDNSCIHASFHRLEKHAKYFPNRYNKRLNFVGEYVLANNTSPKEHKIILRNELLKRLNRR